MKKFIKIFLACIVMLIPGIVLAQGDIMISNYNIFLHPGESSSFNITANNTAAHVIVSSSNLSVATISSGDLFLDMDSATINVTAASVGSAQITVYLDDATTYDDEDLTGKTYTINVSVENKPEPIVPTQPSTPAQPVTPQAPNNTPIQSNETNNNGTDATLKAILVNEKPINIVNNKLDYVHSVDSKIEGVDLKVTPTDANATYEIVGDTKLKYGQNTFEIKVKSANGNEEKIYKLIINRKELSKNSKIKSLAINDYKLDFKDSIKEYQLLIGNEDKLEISVKLEDSNASYKITGNEKLKNGSIITITVTAENGDIQEYKIKIQKKTDSNIRVYLLYISLLLNVVMIIYIFNNVLRAKLKKDK